MAKKLIKCKLSERRFPGQRFKECEIKNCANKKKFKIGSKWVDKNNGTEVKVVGYPKNDYYNCDYIGVQYKDKSRGAVRQGNLIKK